MEEVIKNNVKTKTITLSYPIEYEKDGDLKVIDKIVVGRLKAKHLEVVPASLISGKGKNMNPKEIIPFVGAICNLSPEHCGEIDFEDLQAIIEVLSDFLDLATSQKTGTK